MKVFISPNEAAAKTTVQNLPLVNGIEFLQKNSETTEIQRANFRKAHEAGVKIVFGTDAGVYPHGQNAKQFSYMTKHGMTKLEAIQAATVKAAEVLGMSQEIGQVEEGFFADIIAVSNNPLTDIKSLEDIQYVIKAVSYTHLTLPTILLV